MKPVAVGGNPSISLRQEREIARFEADARTAIENLRAHFDADAHVSPEQMADYRHRLDQYASSGSKPMQSDLDLPPTAA